MKIRTWILCFAAISGLSVLVGAQARGVVPGKGGEDVSGPYVVVPNWPQPPRDSALTWGRTSSIWAETPDRVFVIQSGMVPWTWKKLQGERLVGATQGGGAPVRTANNAVHCASTLAFDMKGPCERRADGTLSTPRSSRDPARPSTVVDGTTPS